MADAVEYRDPFGVTYDDEQDHVKVMVVIPHLKKAFAKNEPSGGKVNFKVQEMSFELTASATTKETGVKKQHNFKYHVKKLPAAVNPSQCTYKVKDGKILVRLQKAENTSWQATLSDTGLETTEDDTPADT